MENKGAIKKGDKRPNQGKRGPNKVTQALKDMILGALDNLGGQEYLKRQGEENPVAFMTLLGKVLPTTLAGDPSNPVVIQEITRRITDPQNDGAGH